MSKHAPVALADNVSVEFASFADQDPSAVFVIHERPDRIRCVTQVMLDNLPFVRKSYAGDDIPWANAITMVPLTLDEQITCKACGFTGYVHAGRWLPA